MKNERRLLPDIILMWNTTTMTQTEVGEASGLPRGSIGRLLSEARRDGLTVKRRVTQRAREPLTDDQIAWMVAARRAGLSLLQISAQVGGRDISYLSRVITRNTGERLGQRS